MAVVKAREPRAVRRAGRRREMVGMVVIFRDFPNGGSVD